MDRETIGWIFIGLSIVCGIRVLLISASTRSPHHMYDPRSVFEREYEHQERLAKNPTHGRLVFLGLLFGLIGMYLVGMFG
jgi:hypothetical protein